MAPPPHLDAFGGSAEYTVGVEEEFMVLDAATLALAPRASELIDAAGSPNIKHEIRQCMVETTSRPASSTADLHTDLLQLRRWLTSLARARELRIAGAGAHPFSPADRQEVTDTPRYRYVAGLSGWAGRRSTAVFGMHVHVAVRSAEKALGVAEALVADLPALLALSAASPLWEGVDTGFASARLAVRSELPRTGLPPRFRSLRHYRSVLESLQGGGLVPDPSYLWWDVRLQERLGTIEVRLMDAQPSLLDAVALAGLVRAVIRHHGEAWDMGLRPESERVLAAENRWQAVRHGMSAVFARPAGAMTARHALDELILRVAGATGWGVESWIPDRLTELAASGGRATELRDRFVSTDDLVDVVGHLVDLGERDLTSSVDVPVPELATG